MHRPRKTFRIICLTVHCIVVLLQLDGAVSARFDALQPDQDRHLDAAVSALNELLRQHIAISRAAHLAVYDCAQTSQAAAMQSVMADSILRPLTNSAQYVRYYEQIIAGRLTNVMLVDGVTSFQTLIRLFGKEKYDVTSFFIVCIVPNPSNTDAGQPAIEQQLLTLAWSLKLINIIVLSIATDSLQVHVYTHFPFASTDCERIDANLLTTYTVGHGFEPTIGSDLLFPDKYRNLHKCPLYIATYPFVPHVIIPPDETTESGDLMWYDKIDGLDGHVLMLLQDYLNFSSKITNRRTRGLLLGERNGTDCFGMVLRDEVNMTLGNLGYVNRRLKYTRASTALYSVSVVFAVPPGRHFSALDRLLQPFQPPLWLLIGATCVAATVVLLLQDTSAISAERRRLCVGHDTAPLLTAIAVALGCSVLVLPRHNFARFMFVNWTTLALVLRTVYQAGLCYFMQRQLLQPQPATLHELVAANYTIYMEPSVKQILANFTALDDMNIIEFNKEQSVVLEALNDTEKNDAYIVSAMVLADHNRRIRVGPRIPVPRERIMEISTAIFMPFNCSLELALNWPIQQMTSAGFLSHWMEGMGLKKARRHPHVRLEPKILLLSQALGVFWICAILLAVSFAVFLLELLVDRERIRNTMTM